MKFLELRMTGSDYKYYLPISLEARRACEFANEKYLSQAQIKILELLGHKIEKTEEKNISPLIPLRKSKKELYYIK
jgi:hypothetical protein